MIRQAWSLAAKDLRMYFRDRSGLVASLLVPIALVTVFGWIMAYAFGGGSGMPKVTVWIVDEDNTERSRQFVESLRASNMLQCRPPQGEQPIDRAELKQMVTDGDAHHGLVIPAGFGSQDQSAVPDIDMLRDPGRTMEGQLVRVALVQALFGSGDTSIWKQSLQRWAKSEGADAEELKQVGQVYDSVESTIRSGVGLLNLADKPASETAGTEPAAGVEEKKLTMDDLWGVLDKALPVQPIDIQPPKRPKRVTYQQAQSISGVTVMMMMFSLTNAGALLLAERERGTLKRLLSMPMQRESILLGKFFYVIVAGLIQMAVLMVYGELMFKVGLFRDPVTLLVLIVTWVATAGSFGMAIATLSTSTKQGDGLATIIILVMAALGGCWFPVQMMNLPLPLEIASRSTLTYWAMEGFQSMLWNAQDFTDSKILKALGVQWLWTIVLSTISWFAFKRNYLR